MGMGELFILAVGLSMDACAVAAVSGISRPRYPLRELLATAAVFGAFQGLMPLLGYLAGSQFLRYMAKVDHVIALLLLGYLGGRMLLDGFTSGETMPSVSDFTWKGLLVQGIATSIDALAAGVSLAALEAPILFAAAFIAGVTFCCSILGVWLGKVCGPALGARAQIFGGGILIAIGGKIFLEHTLR